MRTGSGTYFVVSCLSVFGTKSKQTLLTVNSFLLTYSVHRFRAHGNENWEFNENGLMAFRHASINDVKMEETDRKFFWPQGSRPQDHPGLSDLGL